MKSDAAAHNPMSPAAFHILLTLADNDKHGWAILKEVEEATWGEVKLSPGTLYGLLKRLLDQELIAESDQRPPRHWDDSRRRYYRLTQAGRQLLQAEIERLDLALRRARSKNLQPVAKRV